MASQAEQETRPWVALTWAKVPTGVKDECDRAMQDFGFPDLAEGYRTLAKLFARSERVRQACQEEMHVAVLDRPEAGAA